MRILTVVGARPQFVKAAVLSREIKNHPDVEEILLHTGQHYDSSMSEVFFEQMDIPKPQYNLNINSVSHGAMTGRMLEGIEKVLQHEKPDLTLVYGDTNSTLAGALASKKLHIPVGHVEAGLRSFNMMMPEEVNRILTDRISNFLFCPTDTAIKNLKKEGFDHLDSKVIRTGDIMYDAAMYYSSKLKTFPLKLPETPNEPFILSTLHRAENTGSEKKLKGYISALNEIHHKVSPVVMPLHPATKNKLDHYNISPKFHIIDPVGYFEMIALLKKTKLVITDSGGLQKEAFFFKKPCITMREQTEWIELIEKKFNTLATPRELKTKAQEALDNKINFDIDLYGDGKAARLILQSIPQ